MARPTASTRSIVVLVAAVLVAIVCARLGIWQLDRLQDRRALNAAVESGLARPTGSLEHLLPAGSGVDPGSLAYRRAEATGTYDVGHEVVLYGRTQDGRAGNHVLTPLVMDDGRALIVDRGWVPIEEDRPPVAVAAPPAAPVTVTGVLLPTEPGGEPPGDGSGRAPTTLARVDLGLLDASIPGSLVPLYLQLEEQRPPQRGPLPQPAPLPELDEGPHLSYAFQWFAFAAISLIGGAVLALRDRATGDPQRAG